MIRDIDNVSAAITDVDGTVEFCETSRSVQ